MVQTRVDTYFFDGALSAADVAERVGQNAVLASTLTMENSRAAVRRLAWANSGMGTVFAHYAAPRDRLRGLSRTLWNNRDIQYIEDIAEIRRAIAFLVGDDEDKLFVKPNETLMRKFDQPTDGDFFPFDCSLRGGAWGEDVKAIADALDGQIAEFLASRFNSGVEKVCTMVLKVDCT